MHHHEKNACDLPSHVAHGNPTPLDDQPSSAERPSHEAPTRGLLEAALSFARRGYPVLPCRPDKSPCFKRGLIERGHLDASSDADVVRRFWKEFPSAWIGVPLGDATGRFVLDIDVRPEEEKDGYRELRDLEEQRGPLPPTLTFRSLSGGEHRYFRHPEFQVKNRTGVNALRPGLEIKGDGGYVIVPPSPGYGVKHDDEVAEAPGWLLDLLRAGKNKENTSSRYRDAPDVKAPPVARPVQDSPTGEGIILEGRRDSTLFFVACSLRRAGTVEAQILSQLSHVNSARCRPPLPRRQVRKIARSASRFSLPREPVSESVRADLTAIERRVELHLWRGMAGKTDRSVMRALASLAASFGTSVAAGVRISISVRDLALIAGCRAATVTTSTRRLGQAGFVRRDLFSRAPSESGAWILLRYESQESGAQERDTRDEVVRGEASKCSSGPVLRSLPAGPAPSSLTPYLRWGPGCLGKGTEEIIHILEANPGVTAERLVRLLGAGRVRDLKRRHLAPMEKLGLIRNTGNGETYLLSPDWETRLEEILVGNGELEKRARDEARYARQRDSYRQSLPKRSRKSKVRGRRA